MRTALWPDCIGEENASGLAQVQADPQQAIFVAPRDQGGLCGFVEVSIHPHAIGCATQRVGYVEGLYVDPDMRRHGIGRKLLRAAEDWARRKGCQEMASDTQLDNAVSTATHLAAGYREAERAIHFSKRLD